MNLFICRFAQQWEDFRLPELESVARIQDVKLEINPSDYSNQVIQHKIVDIALHFYRIHF